jgi:hypothetical protein
MSGCSQSAIDRRLRKSHSPDDLGNGRASLPERPNVFDSVGQEKRLAPEPHAAFLGFGDAIHLSLAADPGLGSSGRLATKALLKTSGDLLGT